MIYVAPIDLEGRRPIAFGYERLFFSIQMDVTKWVLFGEKMTTVKGTHSSENRGKIKGNTLNFLEIWGGNEGFEQQQCLLLTCYCASGVSYQEDNQITFFVLMCGGNLGHEWKAGTYTHNF